MRKKGTNFSIEEIISMPGIGSPLINKDGSKVVYQVTSTDWKDDTYVKDLWIYDVMSKRKSQLLAKHEAYGGQAKWSPDGKKLGVLLKAPGKDGKNQIVIIDSESLEKVQVSSHDKGIHSFIWSHDGRGFYFLSSSPSEKDKEARDKRYGKFLYMDEDKTHNSLFYLDLKKGMAVTQARYDLPEDLIKKSKKDKKNTYYPVDLLSESEDFFIHDLKASGDGTMLALTFAPSPTMEDYEEVGLCIYDIKTKKFQRHSIDGFAAGVHFSPDSSKVCLTLETTWLNNNVLAVYDLKSKSLKPLDLDIDEHLYVSQWTDKGILVFHQDKTSTRYVWVQEDKPVESILTEPGNYYSSLHLSSDGQYMTYMKKNSKSLFELYVNGRQVTEQSAVLKGRQYAQKEMVSWINSDGFVIEGVLSRPQDFNDKKEYPLLVIIHGGPTGTSYPFVLNQGLYPIESFIDKGFITLEPNYRGSAGYGDTFRASNYRNLGVGDYDDVITGVDFLIDQGFVDSNKIGVMGWSQGGYISAFCTTFSDRFKAISVGAGISNWETYYYNTDIPKFTKEYLGDVPFKDKAIYEKTSPMTHINQAKTQTLIQHGGADARVPVANAYELFRALKELKLQPKMVIFDKMGHGPRTPGLVRAINKQNLDWFCHHILGQDLEDYYLKSTDQ